MAGFDARVLLGDRLVGFLHCDPNRLGLSFRYCEEWRAAGFPLSPVLPLDGRFSDIDSTAFFENTLPEGCIRTRLSKLTRIDESSVAPLCLYLRSDLPGALRLEYDQLPDRAEEEFREVTLEEIEARLDALPLNPIEIWDGRFRVFAAGAQPKLTMLKLDGKYGFATGGGLASDRILKFETSCPAHLLLNEHLTLSLARLSGFDAADARLIALGRHRALEVIRFDRRVDQTENGVRVRRRYVIDACQSLGLLSFFKYEDEHPDGISLKRLSSLAQFMADPRAFRLELFRRMVFCLLAGCSDMHGKNISFARTSGGFMPAPVYDLANARILDGIDSSLAMSVGGCRRFEDIDASGVLQEANGMGLTMDEARAALREVIDRVEGALDEAMPPDFAADEELRYAERWRNDVASAAARLLSS